MKSLNKQLRVRFKNKTINTDKLKQIPILTSNGEEILLGDLGTVTYQLPPDNSKAVFDGKPCVNVNVLYMYEYVHVIHVNILTFARYMYSVRQKGRTKPVPDTGVKTPQCPLLAPEKQGEDFRW